MTPGTSDRLGGDCSLSDGPLPGERRLPNVQEIDSLLHVGIFDPTLLNTARTAQRASDDPFVNVRFLIFLGDFYWTSTTLDASLIADLPDLKVGFRDAANKNDPRPLLRGRAGVSRSENHALRDGEEGVRASSSVGEASPVSSREATVPAAQASCNRASSKGRFP